MPNYTGNIFGVNAEGTANHIKRFEIEADNMELAKAQALSSIYTGEEIEPVVTFNRGLNNNPALAGPEDEDEDFDDDFDDDEDFDDEDDGMEDEDFEDDEIGYDSAAERAAIDAEFAADRAASQKEQSLENYVNSNDAKINFKQAERLEELSDKLHTAETEEEAHQAFDEMSQTYDQGAAEFQDIFDELEEDEQKRAEALNPYNFIYPLIIEVFSKQIEVYIRFVPLVPPAPQDDIFVLPVMIGAKNLNTDEALSKEQAADLIEPERLTEALKLFRDTVAEDQHAPDGLLCILEEVVREEPDDHFEPDEE